MDGLSATATKLGSECRTVFNTDYIYCCSNEAIVTNSHISYAKLVTGEASRKTPLPRVVSAENMDSDSKAEDVVDDHAFFMASTGLKRDVDSGYDTNSLLEQWMTTKWDDDYDPFDDDLYESHHMSENLQAISDDLDITTRGRKKK
nr:hypothetical protein [Tanacetum cinerariifolium]